MALDKCLCIGIWLDVNCQRSLGGGGQVAEERNTYCQSLGHMNELSWGMNARNEDIKVCARRTEQVLMSRVEKSSKIRVGGR